MALIGTQNSATVKNVSNRQREASGAVRGGGVAKGLAQVKVEEGTESPVGSAQARLPEVKSEDVDVSVEEPVGKVFTESDDALRRAADMKARRLAMPLATVGGKERKIHRPAGREKHGVDRDSWKLGSYHRSKLRNLLSALTQQRKWHHASGVVSILLGISSGSANATTFEGRWSDFAAAMEVLRRIDGVVSDDLRVRRMFRVFSLQQPNARCRGTVQLELALYLMSVGDREAAYDELRPIVDGKHFREDPVANLCHGINSYCLWYEKCIEEVSKLEIPDIGCHIEKEGLHPIEGTDENDAPEADDQNTNLEWGKTPQSSLGASFLFRSSQGSVAASQRDREDRQFDEANGMRMGIDVNIWQASQKSIYEETDEQGFVQTGEEFWRDVIVPVSPGLDQRLFPIQVPQQLDQTNYTVPMKDGRTRDLHAAAVKHLKQALSSAPDMLPALLPLVQLLLAVQDIKGAVDEIDKCSQALKKHFIPPSIKVALLESLSQKDPAQLAACHRDVLIRNPSSLSSLKSLFKLHASGNVEMEILLECICLHMDVDLGSIDTWKMLSSCFLQVEERLEQSCGGDMKSLEEIMESHREGELGGHTEQVVSRDYLQVLWLSRHRWWLKKHFSTEVTNIEQQQAGNLWLLAYKAACAVHIYGTGMYFVEHALNVLEKEEDHGELQFVEHHCLRALKLFAC